MYKSKAGNLVLLRQLNLFPDRRRFSIPRYVNCQNRNIGAQTGKIPVRAIQSIFLYMHYHLFHMEGFTILIIIENMWIIYNIT